MKNLKKHIDKIGLTIATVFMATPIAGAYNAIEPVPINLSQETDVDVIDLVGQVGGFLLALAGVLGVVYLIYGGILYITGGTKGQENAKGVIINALVGLLVVALSWAIASFVLNFFNM
ncbi:MAG: hypothetical protein U9M89_01535 [Patescibacteria group bacterium]|nr:hypothetical protein [Patescibacteria group bacterium]